MLENPAGTLSGNTLFLFASREPEGWSMRRGVLELRCALETELTLTAGMERPGAVNAAWAEALRGETELGFTTIDLLGLDLFSGQGKSYKLGAAPTYLRQKGRVKKLAGSALPAGLDFGQENGPDIRSFQLGREDLAVMVSDGVSDGEEDDWLWQTIRDFRGKSPKELAAQVLERSSGGRDDRTVIVLQLKTRDKPDGNRPY